MIEQERAALRGDADQEASVWHERLADAERKRSGFQDMAAAGLITLDELRVKLAALEETRETAQRELAALCGRRERLGELERDRDTLLETTPGSCPKRSTRSPWRSASAYTRCSACEWLPHRRS
jgi:hypothetical protein